MSTSPEFLSPGHPKWREAFDAKLAHDRAIAPTPTPAMVRAYAVDRLRSYLECGLDPDRFMHEASAFGPARDGKPAYGISGPGAYEWDGDGKRYQAKRGEVVVALGERGRDRLVIVFKVSDLLSEIRSGAVQLDLFGTPA